MVGRQQKGLYARWIKRLLDFNSSLIALVFLSPLLLFIAILVKFKLGSPVIYKQERPGYDGKIFTLYKFRSMLDVSDEDDKLLSDFDRLTKFGLTLRAWSLDELPELFNVVKGDMSLVGPRPLLTQYLPLYNEEQKRRHEVRPGLTGLAQVNGRNALSWQEKFKYDVEYVDNVSFVNDMKIIFRTVQKVFTRDGINSEPETTMDLFTGNM